MVLLSAPLRGSLRVTSPYGVMTIGGRHTGVDFAARSGTPVYAAAGGVVRRFENFGGGHMLAIAHDGGVETRYAHLLSRFVNTGQRVAAGQEIATSGSSGAWVTGPVLHFEVLIDGQFVDPAPLLGVAATGNDATLASDKGSTIGKRPNGPFDENGTIIAGPRVKDANGEDYFPNVQCDAGWVARPAGLTLQPMCFPAGQAPGPLAGAEAIPGDLVELALPTLLEPAINIAVVLAVVYMGWQGVKKVVGA